MVSLALGSFITGAANTASAEIQGGEANQTKLDDYYKEKLMDTNASADLYQAKLDANARATQAAAQNNPLTETAAYLKNAHSPAPNTTTAQTPGANVSPMALPASGDNSPIVSQTAPIMGVQSGNLPPVNTNQAPLATASDPQAMGVQAKPQTPTWMGNSAQNPAPPAPGANPNVDPGWSALMAKRGITDPDLQLNYAARLQQGTEDEGDILKDVGNKQTTSNTQNALLTAKQAGSATDSGDGKIDPKSLIPQHQAVIASLQNQGVDPLLTPLSTVAEVQRNKTLSEYQKLGSASDAIQQTVAAESGLIGKFNPTLGAQSIADAGVTSASFFGQQPDKGASAVQTMGKESGMLVNNIVKSLPAGTRMTGLLYNLEMKNVPSSDKSPEVNAAISQQILAGAMYNSQVAEAYRYGMNVAKGTLRTDEIEDHVADYAKNNPPFMPDGKTVNPNFQTYKQWINNGAPQQSVNTDSNMKSTNDTLTAQKANIAGGGNGNLDAAKPSKVLTYNPDTGKVE